MARSEPVNVEALGEEQAVRQPGLVVWWRRHRQPGQGPSIVVEWIHTVSEVVGVVEVGRDRVLDRTVVSSRVADAAQVGSEVVVVPAHEMLALLTARQRLIVGGCHVHRVGLADVYGIDVIAAVAVRDGSSTLVFLEEQLGQQSAERMARWAEQQINQISKLSVAQRIEAGWVHQPSGWQLLARQQ